MTTPSDSQRMEKIVSLCKRRGFIFQSSEIYGGLNGVWDYGPLGVELKRNLKNYWWRVIVHERDDMVGMDGSILTHPAVLTASGHVEGFADPMVDCLLTGKRFRADQLEPQQGWVLSFIGAVDFDSFNCLVKEQNFPERSAIWSRVDLAPLLRQIFTNSSWHLDEKRRAGYCHLPDQLEERKEALRALIGQRIFSASSFQPFSAMDIGSDRNAVRLSDARQFNP